MTLQSSTFNSRRNNSLEITLYSDEVGEITVDGEEDDEEVMLPNGILYNQDDDDDYQGSLFEMDDIPSSSINIHCPVDITTQPQVRYFVPTNEEPHGLSQSVITNDNNYLYRNIMEMRLSSHNYHHQPEIVTLPEEEEVEDHSLNNQTIYSQSAPTTTSFLLEYYYHLNQHGSKENEQYDADQEYSDDDSSTVTVSPCSHIFINSQDDDFHSSPTTSTPQQQQADLAVDSSSQQPDKEDGIAVISSLPQQQQQNESDTATTGSVQCDVTHSSLQLQIDDNNSTTLVNGSNNNNSFGSWNKAATKHFMTNGRIDYHQSYYGQLQDTSKKWQSLHLGPNAYGNVTKNSFVYQCMARRACSMKVTGLNKAVRFKDVQAHFFDSHVVSIRYIRTIQCAHVAYRNYEEMVKSISRFDKTAICGSVIYCRPSFHGELDRDHETYSIVISNRSADSYNNNRRFPPLYNRNTTRTRRNIQYYNNRISTTTKRPVDNHDTFIPERHGIIQKLSSQQQPNNDSYRENPQEPTETFVCRSCSGCYNTAVTTLTNSSFITTTATKNQITIIKKKLAKYHPNHISTTNMTAAQDMTSAEAFSYRGIMNQYHLYYFRYIFPNLNLNIMPSHYIMMKPWAKMDVKVSQHIQYWSTPPHNAMVLNYLFNNSPEVNFIFSVTASGAFQGYAVMKSEFMILKDLSSKHIIGTPLEDMGGHYKSDVANRSWRCLCRVEWKSERVVSSNNVGGYLNSWYNNTPIRYSKDCVVIEPNLGNKIVQEISILLD